MGMEISLLIFLKAMAVARPAMPAPAMRMRRGVVLALLLVLVSRQERCGPEVLYYHYYSAIEDFQLFIFRHTTEHCIWSIVVVMMG